MMFALAIVPPLAQEVVIAIAFSSSLSPAEGWCLLAQRFSCFPNSFQVSLEILENRSFARFDVAGSLESLDVVDLALNALGVPTGQFFIASRLQFGSTLFQLLCLVKLSLLLCRIERSFFVLGHCGGGGSISKAREYS
jgi:hypothetical protein